MAELFPEQLFWASFAGKNFTDRQRIKRKAESWASRYQAMPAAERLAVLSAMMAVVAEGRQAEAWGPDDGQPQQGQKVSLRQELDTLKAGLERLCATGQVPQEARALIQALLGLFELLMAVFMEKSTPKTSGNSSLRVDRKKHHIHVYSRGRITLEVNPMVGPDALNRIPCIRKGRRCST